MPTPSPLQGFPVPADADDPNIPADTMALAQAIEKRVVMVFDNASARDTTVGGTAQEGMFAFLKDTNALTYYDGAAWQPAFPRQPAFYLSGAAPTDDLGFDGDMWLKT
jgi:hypothetical protein